VTLPYSGYPHLGERLAFTQKLMEELGRQPGVVGAGITTKVPLSGRNAKSAITVKGRPIEPGTLPRVPYAVSVDGDYLPAMRLPLREGRFLTAADSRRKERSCVVDETFARHYWPRGGALGQVLFLGSKPQSDADGYTIVGVVGTAKQAEATEGWSESAVYFPWAYRNDRQIWIVVRTSGAPESLGATLQRIVRRIDPELPLSDIRSMEVRVSDSLVARRAPALLAGIFAGVALLLAAIGTYGVLSYAVAQRRREIGVRMALGARPGQIHRQFFGAGLRLLAGGSVVGALGAWLASRAMQTLLYEMPSLHLPALAGAAGVIGLTTLLACLLPAHRAATISPVEALSDQ
jgi:predicted permease